MIIQIHPILDRKRMKYGYELLILQNSTVTKKQRLINATDFVDITIKSAELQALIDILSLIEKSKQYNVTIYLSSTCIINLANGNITPRSILSKQFVKLYTKYRKNKNIIIKELIKL